MIFPLTFYQDEDTVKIAKQLLGNYLFTNIDGNKTGGIIVETECYLGINDKASHAYNNRKTDRTKMMYEIGGTAYVYLCYGMHSLLNVVTNKKDIPHAVLIRAIEPTHGIETMVKRRNKPKLERSLTAGPGALTKALKIGQEHNGLLFNSPLLWIEESSNKILEKDILKSPRVGVEYAKEDAKLPYRFRIRNNNWTSIAN